MRFVGPVDTALAGELRVLGVQWSRLKALVGDGSLRRVR